MFSSSEFTQVAEDWKGGGGRNQRGRKHQWGMVRGRSPFLSAEDEESARVRIDRFMLEVLIPLAERTNAIVVCEAVKQVSFFFGHRHFMSIATSVTRMCAGLHPGGELEALCSYQSTRVTSFHDHIHYFLDRQLLLQPTAARYQKWPSPKGETCQLGTGSR